jgi:glycosyltransferase involved in cell wall biosynthesis
MPQSDENFVVGYLISTWPGEFGSQEILTLVRQGIGVRVFVLGSTSKASVSDAQQLTAETEFLSLKNWQSAVFANLWLAHHVPARYFLTLLKILLRPRSDSVRCFFKACLLAKILGQRPVSHLHADTASAAALVATFTHQLIGVTFSFNANARDIHVARSLRRLRFPAHLAKAIVAKSEFNQRYLAQKLGSLANARIRCIRESIDLAEFHPHWPGERSLECPTILTVASLVEKNGLTTLISAAHILRQRGYRFQLQIIGAGPLRASLLEKVERLGLSGHVLFLGPQPQRLISKALHQASVFALPCVVCGDGDHDDIPGVLLQAMASGTPVVSTTVAGIPELINPGSNGLLVEPGCSLMLADAVESLMIDVRFRDRLARTARRTVESRFGIDRQGLELLAAFRSPGSEQRDDLREEELSDEHASAVASLAG